MVDKIKVSPMRQQHYYINICYIYIYIFLIISIILTRCHDYYLFISLFFSSVLLICLLCLVKYTPMRLRPFNNNIHYFLPMPPIYD
jgi:hypothetical protein